jgi:hypothetical protein
MSELDEKLKEIAQELYQNGGADAVMEEIHANHVAEAISQIKQAFKEAGWKQVGIVGNVIEKVADRHEYVGANGRPNIPIMTGQEWYDRFKKELESVELPSMPSVLNAYGDELDKGRWRATTTAVEIMKAAKKAAGLEL